MSFNLKNVDPEKGCTASTNIQRGRKKKKELGKPAVFFHFNIERPHGARKKKIRKEERKGKGNAEENIQR